MLQMRSPTINHAEGEPHPIAARILALVLRHANALDPDADALASRPFHLRKIEKTVRKGETIRLVLPAFPAKSPNPEKTLGNLPCFAEVLGLQRLQHLCKEIAFLYAPGAKIIICSDGRVFSDLVLVSDEEVSSYGQAIRTIICEFGLHHLETFGMEEVFASESYSEMRARLVAQFGRSVEAIREEVQTNEESRVMFNGIHRFIFEDRLVLHPGKSRNRVREESKAIAYQVIQRSNCWSSLVESTFPEAIRLSIHPQFSASSKIGFQLVGCENIWGTPWHNVAVKNANGFRLMKRKEAEALGAELAYAEGKYAYFQERGL